MVQRLFPARKNHVNTGNTTIHICMGAITIEVTILPVELSQPLP